MSEVALVTLAPELDNCLDVIQHLVSKGIKVSIGTQKFNTGFIDGLKSDTTLVAFYKFLPADSVIVPMS